MKSSLILGYGSTGQDIENYLISKNINYFIHDDKKNIDENTGKLKKIDAPPLPK